jgi:hypothetical protein
MRTSVAFFFVDELWGFYYTFETILADLLFLGVESPEIISFLRSLPLSGNPTKFNGF